MPPSDQASGFTRLPLKDANRSAVCDADCADSPQTSDRALVISSPCKKQASIKLNGILYPIKEDLPNPVPSGRDPFGQSQESRPLG